MAKLSPSVPIRTGGPDKGPSGRTGGIAQKLRVTAQRHMEDMTLKIFQSFLTLKKAEASQATKAFVLSVTVTQESARGLTHIRQRQPASRRHNGGTGWCLGTRSKNSRILNTLLLPQF